MESQHISNGDMTRAARILVKVSAQYIAREANVTKEESVSYTHLTLPTNREV